MGYSCAQLHVRRSALRDEADVVSAMNDVLARRGCSPVASAKEGDVAVSLLAPPGSPWISLFADPWEGDPDALLSDARALSESLETDALAVACFDSDYLFLNLINAAAGVDAWAGVGSAAGLGIRRRTGLGAWRGAVSDWDAFRTCVRARYICAEECLMPLAPHLALSEAQLYLDARTPGARLLYYALPVRETDELTRLRLEGTPCVPCEPGKSAVLTALNEGRASRGLAVAFTGSYVEAEEITFSDVEVYRCGRNGQWGHTPLTLEKRRDSRGAWMYYGELPDCEIPPKVKDGLPLRKKLDASFERTICLRFTPHGNRRKFMDITVHFIPLQNWKGQCGWRCWMYDDSKTACLERLNRHRREIEVWAEAQKNAPGRPDVDSLCRRYDPADYDLGE